VKAVEPERLTDDRELLDEAVDLPERSVVGAVRAPAPELVVEDDRPPAGELLEILQVVVREAWASVEAEKRNTAALADAPVPDAPPGDVDVTLLARAAILRGAEQTMEGPRWRRRRFSPA
jgi:hypothetical protein